MVSAESLIPMPGHPEDLLRVHPFHAFEEAGRRLLFVVENAAFVEADAAGWALSEAIGTETRVSRKALREILVAGHGEAEADAALDAFARLEILVPWDRPRARPDLVPVVMEPLRSLVLHVAHDCNLRCGYCYADYGRYGGPEGMMTEAMAIAHVDRFFDQLGDARKVHLTMFGGEPLMNLPVVFAAHGHARARAAREGRSVTFSLTTNGTLLTRELVDFFQSERFTVTISIDGPPDVNDRLRPFQDGSGSYETILERVRGSGLDAIARVTLTRRSLQVHRIVTHLIAAGFRDVGVSPVAPGDRRFDIPDESLPQLLDEMRRLADDFVEHAGRGELLPFSNLRMLVEQIAAGEPRKTPCGAGSALVAADDKGDLYACHRLVGQEQFKMGHVDTGIDGRRRFELLHQLHPRDRTPCQSCWARYLCGGGCHHIAWLHADKGVAPWAIGDGFCDFLRGWYRLGLATYARVVEEAPEVLGRMRRTQSACSQPQGL
jgi:uncharacterized protein